MERQSVGAMAGGIVGVTAGGVLIIAGAIAAIPTCTDSFNNNGFLNETCDNHEATVIGLVVGGLVAIGVGVPLLVWGSKKVPVGTGEAALQKRLPAWAGTPAPRGWEWRF
jgi:hypothetical protein